jgi:hypothetical protein
MGGTLKSLQSVRNIWHWAGKSEPMDKGNPGFAPRLDALGEQITKLLRDTRRLQIVFRGVPGPYF